MQSHFADEQQVASAKNAWIVSSHNVSPSLARHWSRNRNRLQRNWVYAMARLLLNLTCKASSFPTSVERVAVK